MYNQLFPNVMDGKFALEIYENQKLPQQAYLSNMSPKDPQILFR